MEGERLELDRMHHERLSKLRQREEEMTDKLRRQQVGGDPMRPCGSHVSVGIPCMRQQMLKDPCAMWVT